MVDDDNALLIMERNKLMKDFEAALKKHLEDAEYRQELHCEISRLRKRQQDDMRLCRSLQEAAATATGELWKAKEEQRRAYKETIQATLQLDAAWELIKHVMTCHDCEVGNECEKKWQLYDAAARTAPLKRRVRWKAGRNSSK